MRSHYDVLGVKKSATLEEIKKAHHDLVLQVHPDKNLTANPKVFLAIQSAYDTLSNVSEREKYDQRIAELSLRNKNILSSLFINQQFGYVDFNCGWLENCSASLVEIETWIENIRNNLSSKSISPQMLSECRKVKDFFQTTEEDLSNEIDELKKNTYWKSIHVKIAIFTAWSAMNDDVEILNNKNFLHLFDKDYPFNKCHNNGSPITIATAFRSKKFINEGFKLGLFSISDVREALTVATVMKDDEMMGYIAEIGLQAGLKISSINDEVYYNEDYDPLFWAIREDHLNGVKFLLAHNINMDSYQRHCILKSTYLHFAIGTGDENKNMNIIKLVFEKTSNLNQKNLLDETPFDLAKKSGSIDIINLFKQSDTVLINSDNHYTPALFKAASLPETPNKTGGDGKKRSQNLNLSGFDTLSLGCY